MGVGCDIICKGTDDGMGVSIIIGVGVANTVGRGIVGSGV